MIPTIMFAIIGVAIDAPVFYWICFGVYMGNQFCKLLEKYNFLED